MKLLVVFYSMYGHILKMAEAEAEGASSVDGIEVAIRRVPETVPEEALKKAGAWEAHVACTKYSECLLDELGEADGVIFGTPTRFGMMAAQMRQYLDTTGRLFASHAMTGKVGGVFTSSNNQHGGQESTILSFHTSLLHHGMIVAGLPYNFAGQTTFDEITGCSPYGASTVVGHDNKHMPTENELAGARYQGRYVALLTKSLAPAREEIIKAMA
jgi:NAD(P)H dehydrogenase (quinone)